MTELCKRLKQQNLEQRLRKQNDKKEQTAKRQRHTHIISTLSLSLSLSWSLCLSFSLSLSLSLSLFLSLSQSTYKKYILVKHIIKETERKREREIVRGTRKRRIPNPWISQITHHPLFKGVCVCVCFSTYYIEGM